MASQYSWIRATEYGARLYPCDPMYGHNVVTDATREHERDEILGHVHVCDPLQRGSWRNRVLDRVRRETPLADYMATWSRMPTFTRPREEY